MIRSFHEMRRDEEGQALVLAAISMLILTLCVLATVNITFAAKEKIRLQNAADAAAYTTAAYEARTMNFLAYTNRAMICQYNSQMNLMALTSYIIFSATVAYLLYQTFAVVPFLNYVFAIIYYIFVVLTWIIFLATELAVPIIDGVNYGMSLAQAAVINSLQSKIATGSSSEVALYNPNYQVTNLSSTMLHTPDTLRWGPTGTMVAMDPHPILLPVVTGQAAYDRLMMVEMVNAARHSFTAYGGPNGGHSFLDWLVPPKIPRQAQIGFGFQPFFYLNFGKSARTEWGALASGADGQNGIVSVIESFLGLLPTEQIYSLDRFSFILTVLGYGFGFMLDSYAYADRGTLLGDISALLGSGGYSHNVIFQIVNPSLPWYLAWLSSLINSLLSPLATEFNTLMQGNLLPPSWLPLWHFGMMPYAKYRPATASTLPPSAAQLFNQPPVLLMVTSPTTALLANGSPFLGSFGFKLGAISSGSTPQDKSYANARNTQATKNGSYATSVNFRPGEADPTLGLTVEGFHAVSAAMAYYHRPGDWQEPPNLFNPMWGAKLMPLIDTPNLANGFTPLQPLFANNLVVH